MPCTEYSIVVVFGGQRAIAKCEKKIKSRDQYRVFSGIWEVLAEAKK